MVIPVIISVIPPTVCIVLALYLALQGWKNRGIKIFICLLLALAAYGVVQVIIQTQQDIQKVAGLINIRTAFWGFIVPLSYHTIITLVKDRRKIWRGILIYLYLAGILLIVLLLRDYTIYREYYLTRWGWDAVMNSGSWFFWVFLFYLMSGLMALFATLFAIRKMTKYFRVQKLAHAILINFLWGATFTILPYFILSWLKIPSEITLAYAGNLAMFLIVFAIEKYHPEKNNSVRLITSLSDHLPDDLVLITPDKKLMWVNNKKQGLNGFSRKALEGVPYEILFVYPGLVAKELDKIIRDVSYFATIETDCHTRYGKIVRLKVKLSGIRNEFNDVTAFLVVFQEISSHTGIMDYLQATCNLSNREKEVADLLLNECSNNEISDRLFISLNTIKTHTRNIYQKTHTTNRSDFQHFCRKMDGHSN